MLFNERNRLAQFGRAAEEHLYDVGSNPALFLFTFIQHKIKKGESYKMGEKETRKSVLRFGDDWVWDSSDSTNPWRRIKKTKRTNFIVKCVRFIVSYVRGLFKKRD